MGAFAEVVDKIIKTTLSYFLQERKEADFNIIWSQRLPFLFNRLL
jgi:hypothetical protein